MNFSSLEGLYGLVHVSHRVRLDKGVLDLAGASPAGAGAAVAAHDLGEGGKQALDPGPGHVHELSRHQAFARLGRDARR